MPHFSPDGYLIETPNENPIRKNSNCNISIPFVGSVGSINEYSSLFFPGSKWAIF